MTNIKKPKYPKVKCKDNLKAKFCGNKTYITKAKKLRKDGLSYRAISEQLGMSEFSVRCMINPKLKIQANESAKKINLERYHNDPEFQKRLRERVRINNKRRRETDPRFAEYTKKTTKLWYERNKKHVMKKARERIEKIRKDPKKLEELRKKGRKRYQEIKKDPERYERLLKSQRKYQKKKKMEKKK